jgi:hypothetical protein
MANPESPDDDPLHHTAHIKRMLDETAQHARADVSKVEDPRARALFETTAEVLDGLKKAYDDFEKKNEAAWR